MNRIKSFIGATVTSLTGAISGIITYRLVLSLTSANGWEILGGIFLFPFTICGFIMLFGCAMGSVVYGIRCFWSDSKFIKIVTILYVVIGIALAGFGIYMLFLL